MNLVDAARSAMRCLCVRVFALVCTMASTERVDSVQLALQSEHRVGSCMGSGAVCSVVGYRLAGAARRVCMWVYHRVVVTHPDDGALCHICHCRLAGCVEEG